MRFWVFDSHFLGFGFQQQLNMVYLQHPGVVAHRACSNAVAFKESPGLSRCEPGCNMEEQLLVGTSTR